MSQHTLPNNREGAHDTALTVSWPCHGPASACPGGHPRPAFLCTARRVSALRGRDLPPGYPLIGLGVRASHPVCLKGASLVLTQPADRPRSFDLRTGASCVTFGQHPPCKGPGKVCRSPALTSW